MSSRYGTILLVEDDPDLRSTLETLLHSAGYEVIATGNGLRAVELAYEHKPTTAIIDMLLPGQSGFQVTLALKERFGDQIRVVIMSGYTSEAHQHYASAAGAEQFLPKPFGPSTLLNIVAAMCPPCQTPVVSTRRKVKIGV
ncbi:chemotaxis protein : Sensor histidine kinase/response regulator OS=Corallococcus coralloides (strain ATCC 25202 / DSM 2259 / NBRC 100086 / M2) GN=luxQ5 PE=4 SV=1: Response_reg [Gemmata massiliana]|uniref:Response regulatory domain-containing protein n=1 Tax=Gemmata massiliana TaxID=1210884 RepID=A0A6P2CUK2_9BACT|nr:response regulator [Gemmata massiliana]VTR92593.1 chemotaxis protein : Sensor histidine kinase/response regulator OS=Corallococcus coralloides (strain ATCC 25202 / DSM 2259 / NBRC 100086 / M2) GN=luxQ5 PE=4 SV=1: Response_reg [Gemmata massiliana]